MRSKLINWIGILLAVSLCFFIFSQVYQGALPKIVEEINNSAIGAILTAFVTVLLLQGQTASEEKRDKSVKVFEKKQDVYHDFLEKLKEIIKDGEITISAQGKNADLSSNVDELKDLLFQLGYIQMHTSEENTKKVFERVSKIIQLMNDFSSDRKDKQKFLPKFYASLSEQLFGIVSILKSDLYGIETNTIYKDRIEDLLRECDLFIDNEEFDKYEVQNYFWSELQKQLNLKGYDIKSKDFRQDINEFYARARNRHRYFGLVFPIYTTKDNETIHFNIEIENNYYYGFIKPELKKENTEITQIIKEVSENFKQTDWWYGWKFSDRYELDFWNLHSAEFERLKHPRKREQLVSDIVNEIDMYIVKFKQIAEKNNL
mgnify:CR=1 FL=1